MNNITDTFFHGGEGHIHIFSHDLSMLLYVSSDKIFVIVSNKGPYKQEGQSDMFMNLAACQM